MQWRWVAGSAAATCALVALVLYQSDLETLSWIAGAGSFIAAVPSLVLALTQERRSAPRDRAAGNDQREKTHRDDAAAPPEVFELTTATGRITRRIRGYLLGLLTGLGFILAIVFLPNDFEYQSLEQIQADIQNLPAYSALIIVILTFLGGLDAESDGRDLIIVDTHGLAVVDKRWVRFKNASRSLAWSDLNDIRVAPARKGSSQLIEVNFKQISILREWRDTQVNGHYWHQQYWKQEGNRYAIAALPLKTGNPHETELVSAVRSALARNASAIYSES